MNEKNKYTYLENTLQNINKKCIALDDEEVAQNNKILKDILEQILQKMIKTDQFFKKLYSSIFYGGSFYDGIRVGHAEEFDLDLLLRLPVNAAPTVSASNINGFVNTQLKNIDAAMKQPEVKDYEKLPKFLDKKNYLITDNVLNWFKSVVAKALNDIKQGSNYVITVNSKQYQVSLSRPRKKRKTRFHKGNNDINNYGKLDSTSFRPQKKKYYWSPSTSQNRFTNAKTMYKIRNSGSGPAVTLKVSGDNVNIDIDLVPCIVFNNQWPGGSYTPNPVSSKPEYFIVPKKPKNPPNGEDAGRYWRLSFQQQERELLASKGSLKPALRLIKKFRDEQNQHCISSYFIKTIFLWEVKERNNEFWYSPLSYIFMTMLEKYCKCLEDEKILYYWNKRFNLITPSITIKNFANQTKNILKQINGNPDKPQLIEKYLLTSMEATTTITTTAASDASTSCVAF